MFDLEQTTTGLSRLYDIDLVFQGPTSQKKFGGDIRPDLKLSQVLTLMEKNGMHFLPSNVCRRAMWMGGDVAPFAKACGDKRNYA